MDGKLTSRYVNVNFSNSYSLLCEDGIKKKTNKMQKIQKVSTVITEERQIKRKSHDKTKCRTKEKTYKKSVKESQIGHLIFIIEFKYSKINLHFA